MQPRVFKSDYLLDHKVNSSMQWFLVHGLVQLTSIVLLFAGLYYAIMKPDGWFPKHRLLMLSFIGLATLGAFGALVAVEYRGKKQSTLSVVHGVIGTLLIAVLWLQLMWAVVLRKHVGKAYLGVHRILASIIVLLALTSVGLGLANAYAATRQSKLEQA
jgi:hypothetical protein